MHAHVKSLSQITLSLQERCNLLCCQAGSMQGYMTPMEKAVYPFMGTCPSLTDEELLWGLQADESAREDTAMARLFRAIFAVKMDIAYYESKIVQIREKADTWNMSVGMERVEDGRGVEQTKKKKSKKGKGKKRNANGKGKANE